MCVVVDLILWMKVHANRKYTKQPVTYGHNGHVVFVFTEIIYDVVIFHNSTWVYHTLQTTQCTVYSVHIGARHLIIQLTRCSGALYTVRMYCIFPFSVKELSLEIETSVWQIQNIRNEEEDKKRQKKKQKQ